jgi:dolichyl-phosphate-mannose-protein mannosyltransferase
MIVWGVHYVPFFLMNRQLFVHHYLPSHLVSALVAGAVLNFILSETINYPISKWGPKTRGRPSQYSDLGVKGILSVVIYAFFLFLMFAYMAPLTYGTPGLVPLLSPLQLKGLTDITSRLDGETVNSKRLLSSWTLHFAAKKTGELA